MTETINGLHSCKPNNQPTEGEIKTFVVEQRQGKSGKSYLKIKSEKEEYGGRPYKIISAKKTDFVDAHGNLSFNLEIEPANGQQGKAMPEEVEREYDDNPIYPADAPQSPPPRRNGSLFTGYAGHAGRAFAAAWEESKNAMAMIPAKDAEELTAFEWLDLRLRIAQGFAIEINKIIRKERF